MVAFLNPSLVCADGELHLASLNGSIPEFISSILQCRAALVKLDGSILKPVSSMLRWRTALIKVDWKYPEIRLWYSAVESYLRQVRR